VQIGQTRITRSAVDDRLRYAGQTSDQRASQYVDGDPGEENCSPVMTGFDES